MSSKAIIATGITFLSGGLVGAEIVDVNPPGQSRNMVDVSHQSSNGREFKPGKLIDGGSLRVTVQYSGSLISMEDAAVIHTLQFPSGSAVSGLSFSGAIQNTTPRGSLDDKMIYDVDVKNCTKWVAYH